MELTLITAMLLLAIKHFIVDFMMQPPYQWQNKGTYGHPGGLLHSLTHAAGTGMVFSLFTTPTVSAIAAVIDLVVHYHIDWAKMNINLIKGWKADTHPEFWVLLGLDQFLHTVTYIGLLFLLF